MSQNSDSYPYTSDVNESGDNKNNITCEGCMYDAPGQRHHMGVGGCLEVSYDQYFPYQDDSDFDQTTISESD